MKKVIYDKKAISVNKSSSKNNFQYFSKCKLNNQEKTHKIKLLGCIDETEE